MFFSTLIQPGHTWIDVVLSLILMLPGIIAAASSLKNGKHLKELQRPKSKPKGPDKGADWYQPPNFDD